MGTGALCRLSHISKDTCMEMFKDTRDVARTRMSKDTCKHTSVAPTRLETQETYLRHSTYVETGVETNYICRDRYIKTLMRLSKDFYLSF